jgi:hypothetical protein
MSRRWLVAAVCVLVLLGGAAWLRALAQGPGGTDAAQILAQIERGKQAAEQRNAGALMRLVSPQYKDEGLIANRGQLYGLVHQQFRDARQVDVEVPANELRIQVAPDGRTATVTGRMELRITGSQGDVQSSTLTPTLYWRKEQVRRYLVFPAEEWRVTKAVGAVPGD